MATGFDPVGSVPVGSQGAGVVSTNYTPGSVTVTYTGFGPTAEYSFSPSRLHGLYTEVLHPGSPNIRFYGLYTEVLHIGSPVARFHGLYVEALVSLQLSSDGAGFVSILW